MPTPSVTSPQLRPLALDALSTRGTCPPDVVDRPGWISSLEPHSRDAFTVVTSDLQPRSDSPESIQDMPDIQTSLRIAENKHIRVDSTIAIEASSPTESCSTHSTESKDESPLPPLRPSITSTPSCMSASGHDYSSVRLLPDHPSSLLRGGSKFTGTQQSDRQVYNVDVEIKDVNFGESFLCGYLRIQGLTEDHPTLTTYFEGEIIGDKHTFQTKNPSWGATEKTDAHHWARFAAWRHIPKAAKKPGYICKDFGQREHIFMRWKEYFLVPDHRVKTINGASFEGFYYICFNQLRGTVSGIYFHAKSEKYQQLELTHVDNRGCFGAMEFR